MPTYLHPGVYVEEIPSGSKPIEGVGTSTAAFVGYTAKGPMGEPNLISKWDDYDKEYGGVQNLQNDQIGDPMGLSVSAFFLNGGTKAYIVRITEDLANEDAGANHADKAIGYVDHPEDIGKKAFKFTAVNEGKWANDIVVSLVESKIDNTLYDVLIGRESKDQSGNVKFMISEKFSGVSLDEGSEIFIKNVVDGYSKFLTVELVNDVSVLNMVSDQYLGTSTSGDLTDVSLDFTGLSATNRKLKLKLDDNPVKTISLDNKVFPDLNALAGHISDLVRAGETDQSYTDFSCEAKGNKLVLNSGSRKSSSAVAVTSDFGIAATLKLGIADGSYLGTSTSGDLTGLTLPLALSNAATYPNSDSRSLKGTIDGVAFAPFDLGSLDLTALSDIAAAINAIAGLACAVNGSRLVLTSDSRKSTSSVVIMSDYGIAPALKLGVTPTNRGGEELSGQQSHEKSLSVGVSRSGDLAGLTLPLALSNAAIYPTSASRSLKGTIDGVAFVPLDLGSVNLATLSDIAAAINAVAGLACVVNGSRLVLTSDSLKSTSSVVITSDYGIAPTLKLGVTPVNHGGEELSGQKSRDLSFRVQLTGQEFADSVLPKDRLDGGVDGGKPGEADYESIFTKFIKYRDINIICLPGQHWSEDDSGNPIIQQAIGHAEKMRSRMVIVDPPPNHELTDEKKVKDMGLPSQTYCVTYYPWVQAANRFYNAERNPGLPKNVLVSPSGYAAGMWAKIDGKRGVWKAAAGMETGLLGISGIEYSVEDDEQDSLNPWGVNCLRKMPGGGPVIWGARTLATKADPEWRYVPVRRTAIMIEQSIYGGIQWAVFEPNDHRLWSALRANIGNFMNGLFRAGAFQGEKASDAYFVRCGLGDTMTQGEIDAGQVIVVVGFAPLKPAEFVIVRIQQKVNQQ